MKEEKEMKNMQKQLKKESGITLIALVITIVVLIILATISITLTLRDGGIFGASETAKQMQEMAGIKEEADLVKNELMIRSYTEEGVEFNKSTLLQALQEHFEGSVINGDKVIVKDGKYEIIVDDNLNISVQKARELQKGDVALSYTTRETDNGTQINLRIELLGIPEQDYSTESFYTYLEEYMPGKTAEELMIMGGQLLYPGVEITAKQVYDEVLKSEFDNIDYETFMADKDNITKEKKGYPTASSYMKFYIIQALIGNGGGVYALYNDTMDYVYTKQLLPELVGKNEPELKKIIEGYGNNELPFEQIVTELTGKSTIEEYILQLNQNIDMDAELAKFFTKEQAMVLIAGKAYIETHPIFIEYPDGNTSDYINWFGSTYETISYTVSEYGSYTFKVTGPSGNTEEITYTIGNITLDKNEMTTQGTLTATLLGLNESELKWTTSDSNIAEIQGEGKTITVIPKSEGEAIITATCGGYSASCRVKVTGSLTIDKQEISATLLPGENTKQETLTATLTNLNEKDLKWTTSDSNIAEIQGEGKTVTVIPKTVGEATITATCGKYSASCKVKIDGWDLSKVDAVKSEDNQYVPVPKGYVASTIDGEKSVSTGFVIKKGTNGAATEGVNEFVWVPVSETSFNEMFETSSTGAIYLSGQSGETGVKTEYYSKLRIRTGDSYTLGKPGITSGVREPDLVTFYDIDSKAVQAGYTNLADMAQGFVDDYKNMRASIKKYKGFYIGRYELTGTVDNPTVQSKKVLTAEYSKAGNWYGLYKACRNVAKQGEVVTSTMIWGCQWDETMNWLKNTKFKDDTSKVDSNSSSWGNYKDSSGSAKLIKSDGANAYGSPQITGYSKEYWSANNICDLAGNYEEFTQEALYLNVLNQYRVRRGSDCNATNFCSASCRTQGVPGNYANYTSARATLYVNP